MSHGLFAAAILSLTAALALGQPSAFGVGQEGNLFAQPVAPAAAAANAGGGGWLYQPLPPESQPRPLAEQSIVTVLVDYRSVTLSEGSGESIKTGIYNAALTDWIKFDGEDLYPAPQRRGDPTVAGQLNSQLRAETELEQREALTFEMAATIVDIRPNGNLVLEGWRRVVINEEVWMVYLSGETARESIGPDRRVRDSSIAHLEIKKFEEGLVRDGYARGWLTRWYGKFKPF
ncbi:flagellar basal body L-ring protein FlgH [Botrimarina sp.]|uniref:flagellar basal body L-ring protein FlgH n=1 Tax=Botrimarina sp. TaxID=2795802 RepID=UPI0032EAE89D